MKAVKLSITPEQEKISHIISRLSRRQLEGLAHFLIGYGRGSQRSDADMLAEVQYFVDRQPSPDHPLSDVPAEYGAILDTVQEFYTVKSGSKVYPGDLTKAAVLTLAERALGDHPAGSARRHPIFYGNDMTRVEAIESTRAKLEEQTAALRTDYRGPICLS